MEQDLFPPFECRSADDHYEAWKCGIPYEEYRRIATYTPNNKNTWQKLQTK